MEPPLLLVLPHCVRANRIHFAGKCSRAVECSQPDRPALVHDGICAFVGREAVLAHSTSLAKPGEVPKPVIKRHRLRASQPLRNEEQAREAQEHLPVSLSRIGFGDFLFVATEVLGLFFRR